MEKLDIGIKHKFGNIDVLDYADDILTLSETKIGAQKQMEIVELFGIDSEIKYNPDKTTLTIFNENEYRNAKEKRLDIWQEDLKLENQIIKQVESVKYLGVVIEKTDKNKNYLTKRRKLAISASAKLKSLGIYTKHTCPYFKGHLYKTFIRPVLMYGMESIDLKKTEINEMRRTEGNIVKKLIGIPSRCRTTSFLLSLNIEDTRTFLENQKVEFIIRQIENKCTKNLL